MRRFLWVIAFLVFVPCAKADSLQVTSGFFQPYGATGDDLMLSGNGFTLTGNLMLLGPCHGDFPAGDPIIGCSGFSWVGDLLTLTQGGVSTPIGFGYDFGFTITQTPIFLSGATQATLSEPATFSVLQGCLGDTAASYPDCPMISFGFSAPILFTTTVTLDPSSGAYDVSSEEYLIAAPEPGTGGLLLIGVGLLAVVTIMRNRMPRGLP
jgi:hypothetical protein